MPEDKIGAWFIRAKSVDELENEDADSCPKEGCPKKILESMPKLGPDDTVFILFHGNAKVRLQTKNHITNRYCKTSGSYNNR